MERARKKHVVLTSNSPGASRLKASRSLFRMHSHAWLRVSNGSANGLRRIPEGVLFDNSVFIQSEFNEVHEKCCKTERKSVRTFRFCGWIDAWFAMHVLNNVIFDAGFEIFLFENFLFSICLTFFFFNCLRYIWLLLRFWLKVLSDHLEISF